MAFLKLHRKTFRFVGANHRCFSSMSERFPPVDSLSFRGPVEIPFPPSPEKVFVGWVWDPPHKYPVLQIRQISVSTFQLLVQVDAVAPQRDAQTREKKVVQTRDSRRKLFLKCACGRLRSRPRGVVVIFHDCGRAAEWGMILREGSLPWIVRAVAPTRCSRDFP